MNILSLFGQLGKSRTMVFNIGTLLLGVADALQSSPLIMANPTLMAQVGAVVLVIEMVLRVFTSKSMTEKSALFSNE